MTDNKTLAVQAADLVANVDQLMSHEILNGTDSRTLYDAAERLEHAMRILLVLGDRAYKDERKAQTEDILNGVPF